MDRHLGVKWLIERNFRLKRIPANGRHIPATPATHVRHVSSTTLLLFRRDEYITGMIVNSISNLMSRE
jgi:hypothetical protein